MFVNYFYAPFEIFPSSSAPFLLLDEKACITAMIAIKRVSSTELLLNIIDGPMVDKLKKLANKGCTLFEMAGTMEVPFIEIARARLLSAEFNGLCNVLETHAAAIHLTAAREGVTNPESFSAAAYDRVMGALGFAPHVH
jgi:hypothetical protein